MDVKYYGFNFPPVGLIDVLSHASAPTGSLFYILDPLNGVELPYQELVNHPKQKLFVIITTHEGASHRWFDCLIPKLIDCGVIKNHIILHSACLYDPDSPIAHIGSIVDYTTDIVSRYQALTQIPTTVPTHHYVCLNRLHRWQRYRLVQQMLESGLDQFGSISYVESPNANDPRFPMVLDHAEVSWQQQRNIDHPSIQGALFNIITETAYEPMPGSTEIDTHHRPGLTEKTFKAILLGQIPIFVSAQYTVQCYRDLGFDAFDDIVDHSYDLEHDPEKRLTQIIDQIKKITKLSHNGLFSYKKQLHNRFQKNLEQLRYYSNNHHAELPKWVKYFAQLDKDKLT